MKSHIRKNVTTLDAFSCDSRLLENQIAECHRQMHDLSGVALLKQCSVTSLSEDRSSPSRKSLSKGT
jgi:hypothetical protein